MQAACLRPTSPDKSTVSISIPFYWLLHVPQSAHQKSTKNTSPTKNQRKATLARCLNISTQASGNRMISLLNVRSLNLRIIGPRWKELNAQKGLLTWCKSISTPFYFNLSIFLHFFEETIAGAWLKRTIVSKNNLNQSTRRHKQIYLNSNTSLEVSWNELKSSDFGKIVNTPIASFRVSPLQFSHVTSKSLLKIISAKEQLKPWLKGTG